MIRLSRRCCLLLLFLIPTLGRADSDPESANHYRQGIAALEGGNLDRAIAEYTEAIRLDPKDPRPRGNRGYAYLARQDFDRAIADFNAALRLDPKNPACRKLRGDAHLRKGDFDQAIADYDEAIQGGLGGVLRMLRAADSSGNSTGPPAENFGKTGVAQHSRDTTED